MKNFWVRTATAVVLFLILAVILHFGGWVLNIAVLLISLQLCHELSRAFQHKGHYIPERYILFSCFLHYVVFQLQWPMFIAFSVSTFLLVLFLLRSRYFTLEDAAICFLILVYVPYFLFPIIYLDHTNYIYLVFVITIATDSFAYLAGTSFGKRKLCPSISPNKTVEGALGAILGTVICGLIFCGVFGLGITVFHALFIGLASVTAQLGDLFASKIKRETGIKDYGNFLPGHGGLLDRFDSILLIIPMVYMLYWFPL